LKTLNVSKNVLASPASIEHLTECPALATLDVSDNELSGGDDSGNDIIEILSRIPCLTHLVLKGNPVCRATRHYRKTVLTRIPKLVYLDERPVFEGERASVTAWMSGGAAAERACLAEAEQRARDSQKASVEKFGAWAARVKERRAGELAELNAERAGRGEEPLQYLPTKSYVSYTTASTKYVTEAMLLKRVTEAAEEAYKSGGSGQLNLPGVMDAGGSGVRYTAEGIIDSEGRVIKQHEREGEGGQGVGEASGDSHNVGGKPGTEAEEEEENARILQEVLLRERDAKAREVERNKGGSRDLVKESLKLWKEREGDTKEMVKGEREEEEEEEDEEEEEREVDKALALRAESNELKRMMEWGGAAETLASIVAKSSSSPTSSSRVPSASYAPSGASSSSVSGGGGGELAANPQPSTSPWFPALDSALIKFTQQAQFDFSKVSKGLRNAG